MGTKMAPSYVNLVLAYLEEIMYQQLKTKHGNTYGNYIEQHFLRYIDDCFIIWSNEWDINTFHQHLNKVSKIHYGM